MGKQYTSNAFLKIEDSQLYAIFVWSQRPAEIIPAKSWLTILEIFVHEHDLEKSYKIFQETKLAHNSDEIILNLKQYEPINQDAIVFLESGSLKIFSKGLRSFIQIETQFELTELSQATNQILINLFSQTQLENDLEKIENIEDYYKIVLHLEKIGLLSPAKNCIDWGDLKKIVPICQAFGLTRGTPVDRYYLNKFIAETRTQIVGKVLEVGGTPQDRAFYDINPGTSYHILNLEAGPEVDTLGDVHDVNVIKPESFDTAIVFNVLEHCYAPWIAVENIYTWLKPGGKCFAMVPSAIRLHAIPFDYWRPLPDAFNWMLRNFSQHKLYIYGNPITAIASYHGIAAEEITTEELDAFHPDYPVAICIVAEK